MVNSRHSALDSVGDVDVVCLVLDATQTFGRGDEWVAARIDVQRTSRGSGHLWDQAVLRSYANSGVLSLGNFGPALVRNHIVCIHDANVFIEPESYSRAFRLAYRTLLPLIVRCTVLPARQRACRRPTA